MKTAQEDTVYCAYTDIKDTRNRVLEELTRSLPRLTEKLHIAF